MQDEKGRPEAGAEQVEVRICKKCGGEMHLRKNASEPTGFQWDCRRCAADNASRRRAAPELYQRRHDPNAVKLCTKCGKTGEFTRSDKGKNGLHSVCKRCVNEASAAYRKSLRGRVVFAWNNMRLRAGNPTGRTPTYADVEIRMTREEFEAWAMPAFAEWLAKRPDETPTVDRITVPGHYEAGNVQVLSQGDNSRKQAKNKIFHAPPGQAWCSRHQAYLPIENFYAESHRSNGVGIYCRECVSARGREQRQVEIAAGVRPTHKNNIAPPGCAWCCGCKDYLPLEEFSKRATASLGVTSNCRECTRKYLKSYRQKRAQSGGAQANEVA